MPSPASRSRRRKGAGSVSLVLVCLGLSVAAAEARADEYVVSTYSGGYTEPAEGQATSLIGTGQDDATATVALPFTFPCFGRRYDRLAVCTNGWAALGTAAGGTTALTTPTTAGLPDAAAPNAVLAPLWADLKTGTGLVRTFVEGAAPTRTFVVDWNGVASFDGRATGLSFQIRLHEDGGVIEFAYDANGTYTGLTYTSAIEDATGTIAFGAAGTGNTQTGAPAADARFAPRIVNVTGRVLRDRPVADASGLGNSTQTDLPVVGATVEIVREDAGEVSGVAATGSDGTFGVTAFGVDLPATFAVRIATEGTGARVTDAADVVYRHVLTTGVPADPASPAGTFTLDASLDAAEPAFRPALNVQQALQRGYEVARAAADAAAAGTVPARAPDLLPRLAARFVPGTGAVTGSAYAPAATGGAALLVVADVAANPDAYDDDVLLRCYGEHVLASLSVHPGALPPTHGFAVQGTAAQAWADGFATFFAAAVQTQPQLVDTRGASPTVVSDLESPPSGARGATYPAAVAGALWDLVDPANEPEDEVDGTLGVAPSTFAAVLGAVDIGLDALPAGTTEFTAASFFDVWQAGGTAPENALKRETARAFIHHQVLADDGAEPNDRAAEATALPALGTALTGRTLTPFNDDVYEVTFPQPDPASFVATFAQTGTATVTLELRDEAGGLITSATNEGASSVGVVRLVPAGPLAPGTYRVHVVWRAGAATPYTLLAAEPLLLTHAAFPDWTLGVPFKQDVVAQGGVAPYTYTVTQLPPGLASANSGMRVAGTPSAAGDFELAVRVADAAMPATTLDTTLTLHVNPALRLPAFFGVPSGTTISADVGSGGTGTVWTAESAAPPSLSLTGGSTLRLDGDSGAPRRIDVTGSAFDTVGATVTSRTCAVVVTADAYAAPSAVPGDATFGYHVAALEGSELAFDLRFRGRGETPDPLVLLDADGTQLDLAGAVHARGRRVRVSGVTAPATGTYHLLLDTKEFSGSVAVLPHVAPPRRVVGQGGVVGGGEQIEVPVDALAGARLEVRMRRGAAPATLRPTLVSLRAPNGDLLELPTERRARRGAVATVVLRLPQSGRYLLRMTGAEGTTGPLQYRVRVRTPRGARFDG